MHGDNEIPDDNCYGKEMEGAFSSAGGSYKRYYRVTLSLLHLFRSVLFFVVVGFFFGGWQAYKTQNCHIRDQDSFKTTVLSVVRFRQQNTMVKAWLNVNKYVVFLY